MTVAVLIIAVAFAAFFAGVGMSSALKAEAKVLDIRAHTEIANIRSDITNALNSFHLRLSAIEKALKGKK